MRDASKERKGRPLPVLAYCRFLLFFCAAFFPVYVLGAVHGTRTAHQWHLFFGWERRIPLVEWMVIPYLSLFPAYGAPLFTMDEGELRRLTAQSLLAIAICGLFFLAMPTGTGFEWSEPQGPFASLLRVVHRVDWPHNLVPSLHVAGGALVLLGSAEALGGRGGTALRLWLAAMVPSTILIHQHHLIDAAAGLLVAAAARRVIPLRRAGASSAPAGGRG